MNPIEKPAFQVPVLLLLLSSLAVPTVVSADGLGKVIRSENMQDYPRGKVIREQVEINTKESQKIAIRTTEGDVLVAGSNAKLKVVKSGFFSHLFGKVYYFFKKAERDEVKVQTPTATIGIRGTKFLVDSDPADNGGENAETVALVEGMLNFEAHGDEVFELYGQRELDEFEKFKREQMAEFQEYKEQMMEEFIAFKKSIDLDAGNALVFDGKKVTQTKVDDAVFDEIADFERFVEGY